MHICMGCNKAFNMDVMLLAHQTFCEGIEPVKREFRMTMLTFTVGKEHTAEVIELTHSHEANMDKVA